jgi:hypothetical protein
VNFDVKTASGEPVTQAEAGKASVCVSEVFKKMADADSGIPQFAGAVAGNLHSSLADKMRPPLRDLLADIY